MISINKRRLDFNTCTFGSISIMWHAMRHPSFCIRVWNYECSLKTTLELMGLRETIDPQLHG